MKKLLAIVLLAGFLVSCSNLPNDADIQSIVIEGILSDGFDDLFKVEAFKKTNGFQQSDKVYIVYVEYDLVFQKSFTDVVREIGNNPTGPQYGLFGGKFILATIQSNFGQFEVGDKIHKSSKVTLIKTEQGWQLSE